MTFCEKWKKEKKKKFKFADIYCSQGKYLNIFNIKNLII